jgi:hypothetical protein
LADHSSWRAQRSTAAWSARRNSRLRSMASMAPTKPRGGGSTTSPRSSVDSRHISGPAGAPTDSVDWARARRPPRPRPNRYLRWRWSKAHRSAASGPHRS